MIRSVDSAGWTWEVCELADRHVPPAFPRADFLSATRSAGAIPVHPGLADRLAPTDAGDPLAGSEASGELYFVSRVGARKLRGYPPTWTQLSRTGLEALCARAQDLDGVAAD